MRKKLLAILHIPNLEGQRGATQVGQLLVERKFHLQQALLWPAVEAAPQLVSKEQLGHLQVEMEMVAEEEEEVEQQVLVVWGPPVLVGRLLTVQAALPRTLRLKEVGWGYSPSGAAMEQGKEGEVGERSLEGLVSGEA